MNAEQFEREIMRQNPAAPERDNDRDQDDEYVWVEPAAMREAAAPAADNSDDSDAGGNATGSEGSEAGEDGGEVGDGGGGAVRGAGRKVSGKRARRGFEERRERRLALQALGQDEWD